MKQQDAIALLKADHKTVKGLFKECEELSDRAKAQLKRLGDRICQELTVHAEIEEEIFYPTVRERAGRRKEERELVLESYEEHALVKHVIDELRDLDAGDETYRPKLKVLTEMVEKHVREEERDLFPGVKEMMDEDELMELGQRMMEMKQELQQPRHSAREMAET
jgi:hemerythrin superfamily protein